MNWIGDGSRSVGVAWRSVVSLVYRPVLVRSRPSLRQVEGINDNDAFLRMERASDDYPRRWCRLTCRNEREEPN